MREGLRNPVCGMEEVGRRCGEKGGLVVVVERDDDMSREGAGDRRVSSSESRSVDGMSAERTQIPRRLGADVSSKCLRLNMINKLPPVYYRYKQMFFYHRIQKS